MKTDNCRGCLSDLSVCDDSSVNEYGTCPCTECLVKVTCQDLCDEAREFLKINTGDDNE